MRPTFPLHLIARKSKPVKTGLAFDPDLFFSSNDDSNSNDDSDDSDDSEDTIQPFSKYI
jgi:hypothetical protein